MSQYYATVLINYDQSRNPPPASPATKRRIALGLLFLASVLPAQAEILLSDSFSYMGGPIVETAYQAVVGGNLPPAQFGERTRPRVPPTAPRRRLRSTGVPAGFGRRACGGRAPLCRRRLTAGTQPGPTGLCRAAVRPCRRLVAQAASLLYRRLPVGPDERFAQSRRVGNPRYGRPEVCATGPPQRRQAGALQTLRDSRGARPTRQRLECGRLRPLSGPRLRPLASGIWHLASGIWHLVSGIWYLVSGIWYLVSGIWYLVSGIWYLVSGIPPPASPFSLLASHFCLGRAPLRRRRLTAGTQPGPTGLRRAAPQPYRRLVAPAASLL
jgi:hypothetical protein